MTCSFLFLTAKMSISSVFVTMLAFNLAVFPCPLFHKLKAQGAEKTADFLQFHHEPFSNVGCPIPALSSMSISHNHFTLNRRVMTLYRESLKGSFQVVRIFYMKIAFSAC